MRKLYIVLGVVVLALAGLAAWVVMNPAASPDMRTKKTITDPAQISKYVVVFARNPFKDDYDISHVAGYVDNVSKSDVTGVKLDIQLLDKDGNRKELVKQVVDDVKAGTRKTYDANAGGVPLGRQTKVVVTSVEVYQ